MIEYPPPTLGMKIAVWQYVHAKVIPGTDQILFDAIGRLADIFLRQSEVPGSTSLTKLCPHEK